MRPPCPAAPALLAGRPTAAARPRAARTERGPALRRSGPRAPAESAARRAGGSARTPDSSPAAVRARSGAAPRGCRSAARSGRFRLPAPRQTSLPAPPRATSARRRGARAPAGCSARSGRRTSALRPAWRRRGRSATAGRSTPSRFRGASLPPCPLPDQAVALVVREHAVGAFRRLEQHAARRFVFGVVAVGLEPVLHLGQSRDGADLNFLLMPELLGGRSEERRVGKECRSRWAPYH